MNNKKLIKNLRNAGPNGVANNPEIALKLMQKAADALEAQEWQPIETAPDDGTRVILWSKELNYSIEAEWLNSSPTYPFGHWVDDILDYHSDKTWFRATHWKPRHIPPKEQS